MKPEEVEKVRKAFKETCEKIPESLSIIKLPLREVSVKRLVDGKMLKIKGQNETFITDIDTGGYLLVSFLPKEAIEEDG